MPTLTEDESGMLALIKDQQSTTIPHNKKILCILEGDLLPYIEEHLIHEFSEQSYEAIRPRISPINFLKRIVDKLSRIYQQAPQRVIVDGSDSDQELLEDYLKSMMFDSVMNSGNEFFNAFKTNLNQPYLDDNGQPRLRAIPNDRFFVYSTNKIDQTDPTHIILPFGKNIIKAERDGELDREVDIFKVYTDDEIYLMDGDGNRSVIDAFPDGRNPFGVLQFMYANRSRSFLIPPIDSDTFRMSVLIPVLMSDLNVAVKYQAFSIIFGINLDSKNINLSPNSISLFKSDPGSEAPPDLKQIKPQVDITQVIQLITTQLAMWLNSRNIRPGSVSDVSSENMVSGISKLVDEMDTSDERKKQTEVYKAVEEKFWFNMMHHVHPYWVQTGAIDPKFARLFSAGAKVEVSFPEQLPMLRRGQFVRDLSLEVNSGFLSVETAMRKLNPEWSDTQLEEERLRIAEGVTVEREPEPEDDENDDSDDNDNDDSDDNVDDTEA